MARRDPLRIFVSRRNAMKPAILSLLIAAGLLAGCAGSHQGGADSDHNVLTGGPENGTTLKDVPSAVRNTLQRIAPHAEVADIDQSLRDGQVVYEISFTEPSHYPKVYVDREGQVVGPPADRK